MAESDPQENSLPESKPQTEIEKEQERLSRAAQEHVGPRAPDTDHLDDQARNAIPDPARLPFGTELGAAFDYMPLPKVLVGLPSQEIYHWLIELHGLTRSAGPIGLDIMGDVVLGRGSEGEGVPDLDLEPFGAFEMGVSRRHAMLRPSKNSLYILDLGSRNGTMHNALRLGSGITRPINHNDTITLGRLTFTVKIVSKPELAKGGLTKTAAGQHDKDSTKPLPEPAPAEGAPTTSSPTPEFGFEPVKVAGGERAAAEGGETAVADEAAVQPANEETAAPEPSAQQPSE